MGSSACCHLVPCPTGTIQRSSSEPASQGHSPLKKDSFFSPQIDRTVLSEGKLCFQQVAKSQPRELIYVIKKKNTPQVHPRETEGNPGPSRKGTTLQHSRRPAARRASEVEAPRSSLCWWWVLELHGRWCWRGARGSPGCVPAPRDGGPRIQLSGLTFFLKWNTFQYCLATKSFKEVIFQASLVVPVCVSA